MFRVVALLFWNIVIAVTEFVAVLRGCIRVETFIVTKKPVYLCCVILYSVPCKIVLFYKCYSLTFWPKVPQFHHFSICNQNQSISNLVIFGSFLSKIPRL